MEPSSFATATRWSWRPWSAAQETACRFSADRDYEERMYAACKIPGGFIKREGRPTEHASWRPG